MNRFPRWKHRGQESPRVTVIRSQSRNPSSGTLMFWTLLPDPTVSVLGVTLCWHVTPFSQCPHTPVSQSPGLPTSRGGGWCTARLLVGCPRYIPSGRSPTPARSPLACLLATMVVAMALGPILGPFAGQGPSGQGSSVPLAYFLRSYPMWPRAWKDWDSQDEYPPAHWAPEGTERLPCPASCLACVETRPVSEALAPSGAQSSGPGG